MSRRRVLIADSSVSLCHSLSQILEPTVQVSYCNNGVTALEIVRNSQPDVLVIDPLLPELDGLSVLKAAAELNPRPAYLVLLQFSSPFVARMLQDLDVDLVLMKPCNLQAVAQRVQDLLICPKEPNLPLPSVSQLLMALNISPKSRGFVFIKKGVEMLRENPGISMTKCLYPAIAEIYGVTPSSVELSLRRTIHNAWKDDPNQTWAKCFGYQRDGSIAKPSNSTFLATVAEYSCPDDE